MAPVEDKKTAVDNIKDKTVADPITTIIDRQGCVQTSFTEHEQTFRSNMVRSPNIYPNTNKLMSEHERSNTNTERTTLTVLLEGL